jgi:hypothetical protein
VPSAAAAPFMANATLSDINSPAVSRIALYLSIALLYEPSANALARLQAFDALAACPSLVRSRDASPFALGVGDGRGEFLRGTVTVALLLILFMSVILLCLMCWVSSVCAKKVERPFANVLVELCNIMHYPSCTVVVTVAAVAQPAISASVVLFNDSERPSDFVFGMITFLYMFAYAVAAGLLLSLLFRCHLRPVVKWNGVPELAPILGDAAILLKPLDQWMSPFPLCWQHPFERGWKQRYFSFFGIYRVQWYTLLDFFMTCIISILLGLGAPTAEEEAAATRGAALDATLNFCIVQAAAIAIFAAVVGLLAALGLTVLPLLPRLYITVVNALMFAAGLSTIVAIRTNNPSVQTVAQAFRVGGVVITYIVLVVRLLFCVSHLPRTLHRVRFWMDKRGHVTQLNFVPEMGDDDAEQLAALLPDQREEEEQEMQVTALMEVAALTQRTTEREDEQEEQRRVPDYMVDL